MKIFRAVNNFSVSLQVSHTGCDYEEIKDTHKQLPTNPSDSSNTIYATAQLPTNPSDSSNNIYATAQLPTNPSDSSNTIYATAQLPTNPSDSSNNVYATAQLPTNPSDSSNNIYATAQLPTNPSDSPNNVYATAQLPTNPSDSPNTVQKATDDSQILITSAEDLNYSVVNFHKKADCPDSVILRNNQDYSEYAAVNHLTAWRATAESVNELKDLILSSDFYDWHFCYFCGLPLSFCSVSDVNKYWILKQNMQLWSVS